MLKVFTTLQRINPYHPLVKYIPALHQVNGSDSHHGLHSLIKDCQYYNHDHQYRLAQWEVCRELYWDPVMSFTYQHHLHYPITKGQLYDTIINFGNLDILTRPLNHLLPSHGGNEINWLKAFLDLKEYHITKIDLSLNDGQPDRVLLWRQILQSGNIELKRPLMNLTCYGDTFNLW